MQAVKRESKRRYSLDEYFAIEEMSVIRHEYYDGEIFAMAGASLPRNTISANLLTFIRPATLSRGCQTFGSDLRVQTPEGLYTYPDLSVVCGEPLLIQARPDTLTNPVLLIEVLSVATREYDQGEKFELYKRIPTLREYVIVEQSRVFLEVSRLADRRWTSESYDDLDHVVALTSIDLSIPMREICKLVFD
jgi:Uma2 family endonuclease